MMLSYPQVQALRYTLSQLINTNQGNLTIENITSPTMEYFVKLFSKRKPTDPLTIASLFYFIDEQLQTAQIILEGDLNWISQNPLRLALVSLQ